MAMQSSEFTEDQPRCWNLDWSESLYHKYTIKIDIQRF